MVEDLGAGLSYIVGPQIRWPCLVQDVELSIKRIASGKASRIRVLGVGLSSQTLNRYSSFYLAFRISMDSEELSVPLIAPGSIIISNQSLLVGHRLGRRPELVVILWRQGKTL